MGFIFPKAADATDAPRQLPSLAQELSGAGIHPFRLGTARLLDFEARAAKHVESASAHGQFGAAFTLAGVSPADGNPFKPGGIGFERALFVAVMRLAGWSWNLLNLMALPLMLGSGVDYSIFMQLALRRHNGNMKAAYHSVGRALLLCGGTAVAGFGSLSWSTNAGMASLGEVCAVGIAGNMLVSVFLLPFWWRAATARPK